MATARIECVSLFAGGRVYNGSSYAPSGHDRASDVTACRPDDQEAAATDSEELKALMTLGDDMSALADLVLAAVRDAQTRAEQVKRGRIVLNHLFADDNRTRQQRRQFTLEKLLRRDIGRSNDRTGPFFPFFIGRE